MARLFVREQLFRFGRSPEFLSTNFLNPLQNLASLHSPSTSSQLPSFSLEERTISLLDTCRNPALFHHIQTNLITSGLLQNPSMAGRMLKLSLDFCDIDYTLSIFKCIRFPDTFCVNTVIKAYACNSLAKKAVEFYFEMLKEDWVFFKPNSFTFPPLISSCAKMRDSVLGRKCHGQAIKLGVVDGVLQVENAFIHMYASCGLIDIAWNVFDKMSVRDLVSWNSMVDGYVKFGDMGVAHKLFDVMPDRNVVSWNIMMKGYLDVKNPGVGLKLFREMVGMGIRGNDTTIVSVVTACGRSFRLKEGRSVHAAIIRTHMDVSLIIGTALIDMYSKCRKSDVAQIIFDTILHKNLVCWNAMILGHSIHGNPRKGLLLFAKMVEIGGTLPDGITFVGVLCACAREGLLTEGKTLFAEMTNVFNVMPSFAHYWCMANLFASHGLVDEAVEILKEMPADMDDSPQSSLWAGLLGSCRFKGDVATGEQIAKALIENDPLNYSYHALLLVIYAVAGRWEDVARMKSTMKERGISKIPGFSLVELTEVVHSLQVGDKWEYSLSNVGGYG